MAAARWAQTREMGFAQASFREADCSAQTARDAYTATRCRMCVHVRTKTARGQRARTARIAFGGGSLFGVVGLALLSLSSTSAADVKPPAGLRCLERLYGIKSEPRDGGFVAQLGKSVLPYDDGQAKNAMQRIESPDLEDMFSERYRTGPIRKVQRAEEDPGRARVEALFMQRYGRTQAAVAAALVSVDFVGSRVRVHRLTASAFRAVAHRLAKLVQHKPELRAFLTGIGGTFAWRPIAGTQRRSAHSYGIAIDLNVKLAHYWRWRMNSAGMAWDNSYPQEIVDAFEAEGFIWGGRWYHYDTMHFEYRPELLDAACYSERDEKRLE